MRTLNLFMATLVTVLGLSFAAQADPVVSLEVGGSSSINASVGDTIVADVIITISGSDLVDAYQLSFVYDVTEVSVVPGSLVNSPLPGQGIAGFGEGLQNVGTVEGAISAAGAAVGAGTYNIGSLSFVVGVPATDGSDIIMTDTLAFGTDGMTNGSGGIYAGVGFVGLDINVVPEPTTASLLGLGLLGLTVAGRRRN